MAIAQNIPAKSQVSFEILRQPLESNLSAVISQKNLTQWRLLIFVKKFSVYPFL